jgi:hypothetical protein
MDDVLLIGRNSEITLPIVVMIFRHLELRLIFFSSGVIKKYVDTESESHTNKELTRLRLHTPLSHVVNNPKISKDR